MKKKDTVKLIIILAVTVVIFAGLFVGNKLVKRIPKNPVGTIGNTASNLYNGGFFCESNGKVYFANSYDSNTLYSMNLDESNVKKLNSASVQYINAGGNYLYYYMNDSSTASGLGFVRRVMGVYRCKKDGRNTTTIDRSPSGVVILVDNDLYYQHYDTTHGTNLYKTSTDATKQEVVSDRVIDPSCYYDGRLYFSDPTNTHFLHSYDLESKNETIFLDYDVWFPIREANYVYFLDVHDNYRLARYNIEQDAIELLTSDRVDCYCIAGDSIFYQSNDADAPALKKISKDGSSVEIIKEGNHTHLCATSQYVYFQNFGDTYNTYHVPVSGGQYSEFSNAYSSITFK